MIRALYRLFEAYSVPLAAAVIGWMFGNRLVVSLLETIAVDGNVQFAFVTFPPFAYALRAGIAIALFILADRYLN